MRYKLIADKRFASAGRLIKNIGGTLVVFRKGVAESVSERTANAARELAYISAVVPLQEYTSDSQTQTPQPEGVDGARISSLYEELGTWNAVAKELGVTISQLRKLREEFGLL